jgi:predicted dehydrogenase
MVNVGLIGLGKMGISHCAIVNAHPLVKLAAVCDSNKYVLDVLGKYTGIPCYEDADTMFQRAALDAVIVATPSKYHGAAVRTALERGLHVFCEKPFCLSATEGLELAHLAQTKGLVNQVGYHYRFVAAFSEAKRLVDVGAIGDVSHVLAEAYGPVVLRPKGGTWRLKKTEGGGCLYDYASHAINLVNYLLGMPSSVGGVVLNKVFSADTDDEVFATLYYPGGASAQISANWCDESQRKMTTRLTVWGTKGRLFADRQELQVYLRDDSLPPPGYRTGWNVRYTTDLTPEAWFYLRGEEYSAQIDNFVSAVADGRLDNINSFQSAVETDRTIELLVQDSLRPPTPEAGSSFESPRRKRGLFGRGGFFAGSR